MKKNLILLLVCFAFGLTSNARAQTSSAAMPATLINYPWTDSQLIEPAQLVAAYKLPASVMPVIFNIGAVEDIKGARHIGAVSNAEMLEKLKLAVAGFAKDRSIVIYCGCCPFTKCPNIRPAFIELKKEGFTNVKLLNLHNNLKTNWIANGYPLAAN